MKTGFLSLLVFGLVNADRVEQWEVALFSPFFSDTESLLKNHFERNLRLAASQQKSWRVLSAEEQQERLRERNRRVPDPCFREHCLRRSGKHLGVRYSLGSRVEKNKSGYHCELFLYDVSLGRTIATASGSSGLALDSILSFTKSLVERLNHGSQEQTHPVGGEPQAAKNRLGWKLSTAGIALFTLAGITAWRQGNILSEDNNPLSPQRALLESESSYSNLRGFFATPVLQPRLAAMGNAGIAHTHHGLINPAGLVGLENDRFSFRHRELPGRIASYSASYASPLTPSLFHAVGLMTEGDELARETQLYLSAAMDLDRLYHLFRGFSIGVTGKLFLLSVGEEGVGEDRITGHSSGMGLDVGVRWPLSHKLQIGFVCRDALSRLRHTNTYTNGTDSEGLPPLFLVGASYQAHSSLLISVDGQKALLEEQLDRVSLGLEKRIFEMVAFRTGYQQIFATRPMRRISVGGGLSTQLEDHWLSLSFSYTHGLDEAQFFVSKKQFGLEVGL